MARPTNLARLIAEVQKNRQAFETYREKIMKMQWIVLFTHPGVAIPTRMGRITHTKMRRILDSVHRHPADVDRIMSEGTYTPLWNVEFYREDKADLITVRTEDQEECEYVRTVASY